MLFSPHGLAVSNGKQTLDILKAAEATREPVLALAHALKDWKYEPDEPIYTPRISLVFTGGFSLGLSLIRRAEFGQVIREYFELPLVPGKGWLIMTYMGIRADGKKDLRVAVAVAIASGSTLEIQQIKIINRKET